MSPRGNVLKPRMEGVSRAESAQTEDPTEKWGKHQRGPSRGPGAGSQEHPAVLRGQEASPAQLRHPCCHLCRVARTWNCVSQVAGVKVG